MKKFLVAFLTLVVLMSIAVIPFGASAATKDDVLNEFASIPASKYVIKDIRQLANNYPLTDEQYSQLMPLVDELKALMPKDLGPSLDTYPAEVQDKVLKLVDRACEILNVTVKVVPSDNPKHRNDDVIEVYDSNGKLIYKYDGDVIRKTDTAESTDYTLYAIVSASIIAFAFITFVVISVVTVSVKTKKRAAN